MANRQHQHDIEMSQCAAASAPIYAEKGQKIATVKAEIENTGGTPTVKLTLEYE